MFITGATGYVGRSITAAFVGAGHEVAGLARSDASAAALEREGVAPIRGRKQEPGAWIDSVRAFDTFVHAAVDAKDDVPTSDRTVVEALIEMAGAGAGPRSLIFTSGLWVLGATGEDPADERASTEHPSPLVAWRPAHERLVLTAESASLSCAVIRPGIIYGGSGGLVGRFFATAERDGAARYVGDGTNRWSLVHVDDVGPLFRMVAEARARGIFHAVDGRPLRVAEVARAASLAAGRGGATVSQPVEEARQRTGLLADALVLDQVLSAPRSRALGWTPRYASFLEGASAAYAEWKAARASAGGA